MNIADKLVGNIVRTKNPSVIGLDPDIRLIPSCYKSNADGSEPLKTTADILYSFNRDIIDTVSSFVPAVKPQIAFYEKYGSYGVAAFEKTVAYARSKGLVVIEDAKRCDIGNTARAYAQGHLGTVELADGTCASLQKADFLTVTPFLGSESIYPFIDACRMHDKGIFVLVKTSNPGSGELQNAVTDAGRTVSHTIAEFLAEQAVQYSGDSGYSPVGAVVGATYPEESADLRKLMPQNIFLVPGYGAQGGAAQDILPCFNPDGLGAIVNSSRGILYTHMTEDMRMQCCREEYLNRVRAAAEAMREDIYTVLRSHYHHMVY